MTQTKRDELAVKNRMTKFWYPIVHVCKVNPYDDAFLAGFSAALASDEARELKLAAQIAFDQWRTYIEMHEQDDLQEIKHSEADHYRQWFAKLKAFDALSSGEK